MKTINLELSKRLSPYLKNIETENFFYNDVEYDINEYVLLDTKLELFNRFTEGHDYKTLTLEEAIIELLPSGIHLLKHIDKKGKPFYTSSSNRTEFVEDTPIKAIEKMLEYLLDNNLLGNK